ncbi:MAG: ABC transporter substrate-binding protein [Actinomycetota bacterium]|nr:ABC transporter substrate-binding protein [Actinomycetota bacterium]
MLTLTDRNRRTRNGRRALATLAAGLTLALTLSACGGSSNTGASSASTGSASLSGPPHGTLTVGLTSFMNTLDPLPYGAKSFYLFNALYDTPITLNGSTPEPGIVQSWQLASDDLSLTLHIRPGVTYSDGTPFDASALVWNINWEKQPAQASHAMGLWQEVTATAEGTDTVKLAFDKPMPAIFAMLAGAPMVKPDAPTSGIGTGPFKVASFTPGASLDVVANPHYWRTGYPRVAAINFKNYLSTSTSALALRSGTIDVLLTPDPKQLSTLKAAGDKFLTGPPSHDGYLPSSLTSLLVNTSTPPLNNPLVRQALSLAFDREQYVQTSLSSSGTPAESVVSPTSKAYEASPGTASFNLQKAKSLLAQAGVHSLHITVDDVSVLPQSTFLPVYQQDLAKIGVTLTINQVDVATWATIVGPGKFPQLVTQLNSFPDADPAISFGNLDLGGSSEHFSSPTYTAMLNAAAHETDPAKRLDDYRAIGAYLSQQMFIIPLATGGGVEAAYAPNVHNVRSAFAGTPDFGTLSLG